MSNLSVKFAGAGCVVELMQGGRPLLAWVLEEQSGQLRLWTINKREMKLAAGRVLPWIGPAYAPGASRQEIQERLEERRRRREELAQGLDMLQLWELAQGEIRQAEARWFAELIWPQPDADQVAAMGQALLAQKTHFKFSPPVFEVYPAEVVEQREAKQLEEEARMELATVGAEIFRKLYEASRQRRVLPPAERPSLEGEEGAIARSLAELLKTRIADPDAHDADGLWKLLIKALPQKGQGGQSAQSGQGGMGNQGGPNGQGANASGFGSLADEPHLPLMLAIAWGLLPEHYNFWLDRAGYNPANDWYAPYQKELEEISAATGKFIEAALNGELPEVEICTDELVSVDPDSTRDWDDAFWVQRAPAGGYRVKVALACPALAWPFAAESGQAGVTVFEGNDAPACEGEAARTGGDCLDRAVFRRASSIYLPEAEYFMMPAPLALGCFSLKAGEYRPALLLHLEYDAEGVLQKTEPSLGLARVKANLSQKYCESLLNMARAGSRAGAGQSEQDVLAKLAELAELAEKPEQAKQAAWDNAEEQALAEGLAAGLELAQKLQARRLESGAVITERPDLEIKVQPVAEGPEGLEVSLERAEAVPGAQLLVGELMVGATISLAQWAAQRGIALLYRSQDVVLPKEFSGIWRREEEIAKVLKALPPSLLGVEPKPHAGLGVRFYSSFTAPIRRYQDLLNQAQVVSFLRQGQARLSKEALAGLLPLLNSRLEQAGQIQRFRPRYWKLLFFQQQEQQAQRRPRSGQSRLNYWDAVITEENNYYVGVMVEAAQLYLRGPRQLFGGRTMPGMPVRVRLGKINPLRNEIQIMEVLEG